MRKLLLIAYLSLICLLIAGIRCHAQSWTANKKYAKADTQTANKANKAQFQCWGTTQKGERCKRKVMADHSYCYQHETQKSN